MLFFCKQVELAQSEFIWLTFFKALYQELEI